MTLLRGLFLALVIILVLTVAGGWWYLYGPNSVPAARLVPGGTLVFATIPNAAGIATGYETSQLKKIVDSPNFQPVIDSLQNALGPKNLALLKLLLPDLSGQSFIALTHYDPAKPGEIGFIVGMKPKAGFDKFDEFVQQLNANYPDLQHETQTGHATLLGVDYQWIQGNNQPGRLCVARDHGWIITAWGEASLQDCLERIQGKSAAPSLAENPDYQKSIERIGKGAQAVLYFDYHQVVNLWLPTLAASNPSALASIRQRLSSLGGAAVGAGFENGEIVDHLSILEPRQAQLDAGMTPEPCAFETLNFTGPDTRLYVAANANWAQAWKNFQDQAKSPMPGMQAIMDQLSFWAQSENLDAQKIVNALGHEYSLQLEWASDSLYPDIGLYLKVDKPDDFKPLITAVVDTVRKEFATSGVITEVNSGGRNFATLKTVRPLPISPTIIEDGPWFGLFLNENHAVRSMARDESRGLLHNDDFNRQIGDKRKGASEIFYLDSPHFLDQAYRTALPYFSMGAMLNPALGSLMNNHHLPADLSWLAPMGTWAAVINCDNDGLTGYSESGIGNQGILYGAGLGGSIVALQMSGLLPQQRYTVATPGGSPATTPPAPGSTIISAPVMVAPAAPTPLPGSSPTPPPDSNVTPISPVPPASTH